MICRLVPQETKHGGQLARSSLEASSYIISALGAFALFAPICRCEVTNQNELDHHASLFRKPASWQYQTGSLTYLLVIIEILRLPLKRQLRPD
jgi:hypothetical protein